MSLTVMRMVWNVLIGFVMCLRFLAVMGGFLEKRHRGRYNKEIEAAFLSCMLVLKNFLPQDMFVVFNLMIYFGAVFILFKGSFLKKVLCFALHFAYSLAGEAVTILAISQLGWTYDLNSFASIVILDSLTALSYILISYALQSLKLVFEDQTDGDIRRLLIPASVSLLCCMMCMYINAMPEIMITHYAMYPAILRGVNTVGLFLPILSLIALWHLVHRLSVSISQTESARFQAYKLDLELEHYREISKRNAELRRLRHDLKNHLVTIDMLGLEGEFDRQHAYIAQIGETFNGLQIGISSGHLLIDSLLQSKARHMEKAGISVEWNLCVLPERLEISDPDLCSLYGNILDNAIEACERHTHPNTTRIVIRMQTQNKHLSLQVTNSAEHAEELIVKMDKLSQKRKGHPGLGLENCRKITERYQGLFSIKLGDWPESISVTTVLPCLPDDDMK